MASDSIIGKRNTNMDALRLVSMMMVTMLHALAKSDLLPFMGGSVTANGWIAWIIEVFSISAVNIFMLISGYFLISSKFKIGRLIEIVLQTIFYLAGALVIFLILGKATPDSTSIYSLLQHILPIHMETYWFISAYVILYMLLPLIANGVKALSEKQLQGVIACLLIYESVVKSILPFRLAMDTKGYSFLWYLTLFLIGAKIKLYGFKFIKTAKMGWAVFLSSTLLIFAELFAVGQIQSRMGRLKELTTISLEYNHIFVFFAAIGIFAAFLYAKPLGEKLGRIASYLSPYCLGVYLLQESLMLRYVWQDWFGLRKVMGQPILVFLFRVLGAVIAMFFLGICVDALRSVIYHGIIKLVRRKKDEK